MGALTLTEGVGLLMLVPLLSLVGVDTEPSTMPNVVGRFADGFALFHIEPTLGSVLFVYVGIAFLQTGLQRWQGRANAALQEAFASDLRSRLYQSIATAEWAFLSRRRAAEFTHVLGGEVNRLGSAAYQMIDFAVIAGVAAVYLAMAFHVSPSIATLVLACAGGLAWFVRGTLHDARATGARAAASRGRLHTAMTEHLASMKTAKSYGLASRHTEVFDRLSEELRTVSLEAVSDETSLQQRLSLGATALLAVIVYLACEILFVPAAQLLVLLFIFARLMPRMVTLYRRAQGVAAALPIFDAVSHLEQECRAAAEAPITAERSIAFEMGITFQHVSFSYRGKTTRAIDDVDLEIPAGSTVAIVGPSGAGKSTWADLLIGLLSPTSGRILVDNEPLEASAMASWRSRIGYVPQETFLFHDTIAANLRWARPEATDEELWEALRMAEADRFVAALPQRLATIVGDRGVLVSGGERQRLALARALLRRPSLLILDEATSALDSEHERRIQDAIDALHHQMTIVIITHRLSTVRNADVIHVLDGGRLVESGTWDRLQRHRGGRFRDLCRAQGLDDRAETEVRVSTRIDDSLAVGVGRP